MCTDISLVRSVSVLFVFLTFSLTNITRHVMIITVWHFIKWTLCKYVSRKKMAMVRTDTVPEGTVRLSSKVSLFSGAVLLCCLTGWEVGSEFTCVITPLITCWISCLGFKSTGAKLRQSFCRECREKELS